MAKMKKAQSGMTSAKKQVSIPKKLETKGPQKDVVNAFKKKAKSGGNFGMLSVKKGIDNNPNPTFADKIAGAKKKAKSGKKMQYGGEAASMVPMMKKGGKAMYGKSMMKKGGKCKNGC